ncbi:SWD3 [Candida pseudojiufengensis]|uniref:SWD3 n=1 Tax=Candida pseudojiufengensis TaxID=497109 RepID=UPI0022256178|nr:SWD3 [Candida pseudojiufengensis]KAI5963079.1 SWD3 [Candida pseudojiufengensis]
MGMTIDHPPKTEELYRLKHSFDETNPITSIRISPDNQYVALATLNKIKVYDFNTYKLITELTGHSKGISDIKFSPINSNIIASCSDDLTIRIWSFQTRNSSSSTSQCLKIFRKHTYHITTIQFNNKGNLLISGSADETITIWDIISGKILTTLAAHSDPISSLVLTPDNSIIISASYDGLIRLFDLESFQCLKTLTTSTSHGTATSSLSTKDLQNFPVANVSISPNGKYILSTNLDGKIRLWNYMDNKVVKTFVGVDGKPICEKYNCESRFIISNDGKNLIVSGSDKDGIICWDIKSKSIVWNYQDNDAILSIDSINNGQYLVSGGLNGVVNIFELN